MTTNSDAFLQAAKVQLPSFDAVYDELMQFEECQGWAAMQMLAYREHLANGDAASLRSLMGDMVDRLEFELHDGGYGGGFFQELESTVEQLGEILDLFADTQAITLR